MVVQVENISLRERKKQKTRELLIDISTRLFLKKGFDHTSVDDIVEQAELSQRTFFRYFATKEAILFWDHDRRAASLADHLLKDADSKAPFQRIRTALVAVAGEYERDRAALLDEYRIVTASRYLIALDVEQDLRLEKSLVETLTTWNGSPFLSPRDANMVAGAIFGAIRARMEEWFEGGCRGDIRAMTGEVLRVVDILAEGFGPESVTNKATEVN